MEIVKVEKLCKNYKMGEQSVIALNQISFSIEKGEFIAITGASGSRKIDTITYNCRN